MARVCVRDGTGRWTSLLSPHQTTPRSGEDESAGVGVDDRTVDALSQVNDLITRCTQYHTGFADSQSVCMYMNFVIP